MGPQWYFFALLLLFFCAHSRARRDLTIRFFHYDLLQHCQHIHRSGSTYYGYDGYFNAIDFFATTSDALTRLFKCETWKRAAKAIHIIPDADHRDNLPLVAPFAYTLEAARPQPRQTWSFDVIAKALATEEGKRDFLADVEAKMTAQAERLH